MFLAFVAGVSAEGDPIRHSTVGPNPFEPTVTPQESDLLREALERSQTDPAAAAEVLRQRIRADGSAALDFALGNFLFQADQLPEAAAAYQAAVRKFPSFRNALNNLGRVYLMQEQPALARKVFQRLLRDGQADAVMLRLLGHCLLMENRPVSAETAFRQSLVLEPDDTDTLRGLVKCLLEQDRLPEVLRLTRELLAELPGDRELWTLRANAHLAREQYDQAIISIETARELGAAAPSGLTLLGDLYLNRGQAREAVDAYRAAFSSEAPRSDSLVHAAEGLIMLDALDEAGEFLQQAEQLEGQGDPSTEQSARRQFLAGRLAERRGKGEVAAKIYTRILQEDPNHGGALVALAQWWESEGDIEETRMLYERAGRIEGFEARALTRLAQLEVNQGRYRQAADLLETAQTFDPRPHVARYLEQVRRLATPELIPSRVTEWRD